MLRVLLMLAVLGRVEAALPGDGGAGGETAPPIDEPADTAAAAQGEADEAEAEPVGELESGRRADPNYSRLMFAPTGRPLRQGEGYFSDYELVFPGFAVGLSDHFSLAAGVSTIPTLALGEQLFYVSPKLGFQVSKDVALSVGGLLAGTGDEGIGSLGIGFVVGTFGPREKSFTVGFGAARELDSFAETYPILMLGGQARLSDSVSFVTESWFLLDGDVSLAQQPFGVGIRFFGERLSADVGFVLVGELLQEGFPLPWASVTYHFGQRKGSHR
jgi:hypothetical protein